MRMRRNLALLVQDVAELQFSRRHGLRDLPPQASIHPRQSRHGVRRAAGWPQHAPCGSAPPSPHVRPRSGPQRAPRLQLDRPLVRGSGAGASPACPRAAGTRYSHHLLRGRSSETLASPRSHLHTLRAPTLPPSVHAAAAAAAQRGMAPKKRGRGEDDQGPMQYEVIGGAEAGATTAEAHYTSNLQVRPPPTATSTASIPRQKSPDGTRAGAPCAVDPLCTLPRCWELGKDGGVWRLGRLRAAAGAADGRGPQQPLAAALCGQGAATGSASSSPLEHQFRGRTAQGLVQPRLGRPLLFLASLLLSFLWAQGGPAGVQRRRGAPAACPRVQARHCQGEDGARARSQVPPERPLPHECPLALVWR